MLTCDILFIAYTGKCLKPEQFLKAERTPDKTCVSLPRSFYGPDG